VGIIVTKPSAKAQRLERTNPANGADESGQRIRLPGYIAENPECLTWRLGAGVN